MEAQAPAQNSFSAASYTHPPPETAHPLALFPFTLRELCWLGGRLPPTSQSSWRSRKMGFARWG